MSRSLAPRLRRAVSTRALFAAAGALVAAAWVVFGLAPFSPQVASSKASAASGAGGAQPARSLSFEERVSYQRAVEDVYWRRAIWPAQNGGPKPALGEVAPIEATRAKVEDVLRKSDALARVWKRPVTAAQLQAEVERMARESKQPEVLKELWAALDNDPFVIAEVLARPALVERLARGSYSSDENFHGDVRARAESELRKNRTLKSLRSAGGGYSEVEAVKVAGKAPRVVGTQSAAAAATGKGAALELSADEWEAETKRLGELFGARACEGCGAAALPENSLSGLREDENSFYVAAITEKSAARLKVARVEWRKTSFDAWWSQAREGYSAASVAAEAFAYELPDASQAVSCAADDTWTPMRALPITTGTAVWTGSELIVWGGMPNTGGRTNSGSRYNPATDTWTPTSTVGAPEPRGGHTAVWTGSEMIVWGGCNSSTDFCSTATGGRYNPVTDTWTPTSTANAPRARTNHTAVWTGSRMIVWGGCGLGYNNACSPSTRLLNTGGVYDPATDTWTATSTVGAPSPRQGHRAVWTGSEMIVWGGSGGATGGRYNLSTDSWAPVNTFNAPSARASFSMIWADGVMIVWGGYEGNFVTLNTGGRYDPATDTWTPTSTTNAPTPRHGHTAVWTGSEMIVYGGDPRDNSAASVVNTGGRYNPQTDTWRATSTTNAPPKKGHVAVWTGSEMLVWGISDFSLTEYKAGGRYNPATDTWARMNNNDSIQPVPLGVWTGSEVVLWGIAPGCLSGCGSGGGRYNPATNTWGPMNLTNAPPTNVRGRDNTAVWTGTEMIVWGANDGQYTTPGEGGRYNPLTDTWARTSLVNAPVNRSFHQAVWTGSEMIVWGGESNEGVKQNTGGRYDPRTDTWRPTSTANAPAPRYIFSAVWAGSEMIVWGGVLEGGVHTNTGGRYDPATDTWAATQLAGAPAARRYHTAVWAGSEMVVWGGNSGDYNSTSGIFKTGGRYDPQTDTWRPTSLVGAPSERFEHRAVWTGSQMIVWGGLAFDGIYARGTYTGGRYNPASDVWTATSTLRAPSKRYGHVQVWTDAGMFTWGNWTDEGAATHGALYCAPGSSSDNSFPAVRLTSPAEGATFQSGEGVAISAEAADSDGTITAVRFYAGDQLIGTDTSAPFGFTWNDARGGSYAVTATATDDAGGVTRSAPVNISVSPSTEPPMCVLDTPASGATYTAPATIAFSARAAANRDRTLATVQFFDGARVISTYNAGPLYPSPYQVNYGGLSAGTYSFTVRCTDSAGATTTTPPTVVTVSGSSGTYRITGQVADSLGGGIANIPVRLDGPDGTTYQNTMLNGYFQFGGLTSGAVYTVTPQSASHTFTPASHTYTLTRNEDNANFAAAPAGHSITGKITDAGGNPLYPVTVTLSGSRSATAGTDANGNYHFFNLPPGGTYNVQPYKNQYNFEPAFRTYANLSAGQTADFTGVLATYTLSGRVSENGVGLAGVTVTLGGSQQGATTTDASGNYSLNVTAQGSYAVTPSKAGYTFSPESLAFNNVVGGQTGNFSAHAAGGATQTTVWVEDSLPAGARAGGDGESWTWTNASPAPHTGAASHLSAASAGLHQHYFHSATQQLAVGAGDTLVAYVYLDPANPPAEIMLQWNDGGSWEHRAYWGANMIDWGADGTQGRKYMGALPATGQWVRLEVPAAQVGLEGRSLSGMAFTLFGGRAAWDCAGKVSASSAAPSDSVWVEDAVPAGAASGGEGEAWSWINSSPSPYSGATAHRSNIVAGVHQHYFHGATQRLTVGAGDTLYAYVYLDPANLPSELMLQWNDGSWEHRAYWGANNINWGTDGTASRRHMGPLPAAGQWVRLEVPASSVGLEGRTLSGMAFTLHGGRATWDRAGKISPAAPPPPPAAGAVWIEDSVPAGATTGGEGEGWNWTSASPAPYSGSASHLSNVAAGIHQHYFYGATQRLTVSSGDTLYAYVYLDPANLPSEIMLQWNDGGGWEHRAYWGANQINWGADGTASRRHMGALPAAGQWVRLEVPAAQVGLEGRSLSGMAFTLYGGRAAWDKAGK